MGLVRFPSRGGFSVRSSITFCLTVLAIGILWAFIGGTPVHADTDANWSGDVILYDHHGFVATDSTLSTSHGLASGTTIYQYLPTVNGSTSNATTAYFIYFAPGVDPPTATSAQYAEYDYKGGSSGSTSSTYSNPHNQKTISLTKKGDESSYSSSCNVSLNGLGWIICPVTTFLANAMDNLFNILASMIAVQPLTITTNSDNGLYTAWNIMRNIANVAFVIAFLVIIYTQLTGFGVSNYGLKKMIPRLIVAAVLVNLSFYVSAVAIDLSNVAGYSLQDIFHTIREQVFHITDDTFGAVINSNWTSLTTAVLGGGGLVVGTIYAASSGAFYLLIPLMVTLLLTIMVVLIILAARQAIIVVLVILAPLAFVANLLPNTEKLFGKWKDLFMTMLVFFPAFSLVFGGAQLAGQVIIQNAGDNLIMVIFGMAVQVAPLVITPLLLKLSGGILGKIGAIVNNPKKGLLDRNKNWANDRKTLRRSTVAGRELPQAAGRWRRFGRAVRNPGTTMIQASERRKRGLKEAIEMQSQHAENRYNESQRHRDLHTDMAGANLDKDAIAANNDAHVEGLKQTHGSPLYQRAINTQAAKENLERQQNLTNAHFNRQRINPASVLHASTIGLEESKSELETSDNRVKAYMTQQRTLAGGALRHTVVPLEESKLHLEGAQSQYTALVDTMKSAPGSAMNAAANAAQASKEAAEAAQTRLQAQFDARRKVVGSELNLSMNELETSKKRAEGVKSETAAFLTAQMLAMGTDLHIETVRAETAKAAEQRSQAELKSMIDEYKAGHVPDNAAPELSEIIGRLSSEQQATAIEGQRAANASKVLNQQFAEALSKDKVLRKQAGGINKHGADAALASAVNTMRTEYGQSVTEAAQIVEHFNLSAKQRQQLALLRDGEELAVERDGAEYTFTSDNVFAREAAIEKQIAVGTINEVEEIVQESGTDGRLFEFRTTIASALAKNSLSSKSLYLGGKTIDSVGQGIVSGPEGIMALAVETIGRGKISGKDLATIDPIAVQRLMEAAQLIQSGEIPEGVPASILPDLEENLIKLSTAAHEALTDKEQRSSIKSAAKGYFETIAGMFPHPEEPTQTPVAPTPPGQQPSTPPTPPTNPQTPPDQQPPAGPQTPPTQQPPSDS